MIHLNENFRYMLQEEAAFEDFDNGSLVLLCKQLQLIEINKTARKILNLVNGRRSLKQIIKIMADDFQIEEKKMRMDIHELMGELASRGVVKPIVRFKKKGRQKMAESSSIMANPDVSLREENGDGAILFNADTDALLIINPIGLLIWKFLQKIPRTKSDIVKHLEEMCEDVPAEQASKDVDEFIQDLLTRGFIGEVVDEKKS